MCWLDVGYALMCVGIQFVAPLRLKPPSPGPTLMSRVQRLRPRGTASRIDLPCRPTASVRLDTCRRMAAEHLADEEMRLHPLYSCCATIMASSEGLEALEELMLPHLHIVKHVAVYVVTTGRKVVLRQRKKKNKQIPYGVWRLRSSEQRASDVEQPAPGINGRSSYDLEAQQYGLVFAVVHYG